MNKNATYEEASISIILDSKHRILRRLLSKPSPSYASSKWTHSWDGSARKKFPISNAFKKMTFIWNSSGA